MFELMELRRKHVGEGSVYVGWDAYEESNVLNEGPGNVGFIVTHLCEDSLYCVVTPENKQMLGSLENLHAN